MTISKAQVLAALDSGIKKWEAESISPIPHDWVCQLCSLFSTDCMKASQRCPMYKSTGLTTGSCGSWGKWYNIMNNKGIEITVKRIEMANWAKVIADELKACKEDILNGTNKIFKDE